MNHIARKCTAYLFLRLIVIGCARPSNGIKNYEEIPPMLSVLTNVAQGGIEKGYSEKGEQSVLNFITQKKPILIEWFKNRGYKVQVAKVADRAVVMVCDNGEAIFEDTYCNGGFPDKDHRGKDIGCEFTMTEEEVKKNCR